MMSNELTYWFIDEGGINPSLVPPAYKGMDSETAKEVRDELTEAIERVECEHDYTDWIEVGLEPDGKKRWHSRKCNKCDEREGEWREITNE